MLATTGPVHLTESFLEYRSAHAVAAGSLMIIGDGYYTGRWIAAACCCALRRRRQQRRLSGKGV